MMTRVALGLILAVVRGILAFQIPHGKNAAWTYKRVVLAASNAERADSLKAQAKRMRLEAKKMDIALTLEKIEKLERQLNGTDSMENTQEEDLIRQLEALNEYLTKDNKPQQEKAEEKAEKTMVMKEKVTPLVEAIDWKQLKNESLTQQAIALNTPPASWIQYEQDKERFERHPLSGYAVDTLTLFLPVAIRIEEAMPNATMKEKLAAFRSSGIAEEDFKNKLEAHVQEAERFLKKNNVNPRNAKVSIKVGFSSAGGFSTQASLRVPDNANLDRLVPAMTDQEFRLRLETIQSLPPVLQTVYMYTHSIRDDDLGLAILMEHYDAQFDAFRTMGATSDDPKQEQQKAIRSLASLPSNVRRQFFRINKIPLDATLPDAASKLMERASKNGIAQQITDDKPPVTLTSMWRLKMPSKAHLDTFCSEVLTKDIFHISTPPEKILGGYIIRGTNKLRGKDANRRMMEKLNEKLAESSVANDLYCFYTKNPLPLRSIGMEQLGENVLVVTASDESLYKTGKYKNIVSTYGVLSPLLVSIAACEINWNEALAGAPLHIELVAPMFLSFMAIQAAHVLGHQLISWRDKFDIGWPNIIPVPFTELGVLGTITPLKSSPRDFNSLFDFGLAGPLAGFVASLGFLCYGLGQSASLDLMQQQDLPTISFAFLRSSSLGFWLVEHIIGNVPLGFVSQQSSSLPLHPFALSGFVGLIINALALLPIGNTDGGRIATTVFGRRLSGTLQYGVLLATLLSGIFHNKAIVFYALFALITQTAQEVPAQNEADELDLTRGLVAIMAWSIAAITLFPSL